MPSKVAPGDDIVSEAFTPKPYKTPFSAERVRGIAPQQVQLADGRQLEYFLDGDPTWRQPVVATVPEIVRRSA